MIMGPRLRKLVLTIHLTVAVGWIGAVLAYLALDVKAATSDDGSTLRAAWIAMDWIAARVIVPLAVAAVVTGIALGLGTKWGLFRHYWVVISLMLTLLALIVLLSEARVVDRIASVAADPMATDEEIHALPNTLPHSAGGLVVLLVVQVLNIYKPRGLTKYGWRKQREELTAPNA